MTRLTISERAVLRAVDQGAGTAHEIALRTGASRWWVTDNVEHLINRGFLYREIRTGRLHRRATKAAA